MTNSITVYGTPGCVQCTATLRAAAAAGLEVAYVDLASDSQSMERVKSLGYSQAPVVEYQNRTWSGFRPDLIDQISTR